ncbi:unnamed protein product, partial [Symbiodinium necroappetens]
VDMLGFDFQKPEVTTVIRWLLRVVLVLFLAWLVRQRSEQEAEEEEEENESELSDSRARSNGLRSRGTSRPVSRLQPRRDPYATAPRQRKGVASGTDAADFDSIIEKVSKPKEMWQPRKSGEPLDLRQRSQGDADPGMTERPAVTVNKPGHDAQGPTLRGHERPVTFITFNHENNLLFSCGKDKLVCVWSFPDGELLGSYRGHNGAVWSCSATFDSRRQCRACEWLCCDPGRWPPLASCAYQMSPAVRATPLAELLLKIRTQGARPDLLQALRDQLNGPVLAADEAMVLASTMASAKVQDPKMWCDVSTALRGCDELPVQWLTKLPWKFARARCLQPEILEILSAGVQENLGLFDPRGLADLAWSMAKLQHRDEGLLRALTQTLSPRIGELAPLELAKATWAFAKSSKDEGLFEILAEAVTKSLPEFQPRGLANIIWAFATAEVRNPKLQLNKIAEFSRTAVPGFTPQGLANTVWAFAKLRLRADHAVYTAMAETTTGSLGEFSPQNISNSLWAFAKARCYEPELFLASASHVSERLREFSIQAAVNCVWAMAETGHHDHRLLHCFSEYAVARLELFKPQDLSNTLWSYAQLQHCDHRLLSAATEAVQSRVSSLTVQHLVCTTWGYAMMFEHRHTRLRSKASADRQGCRFARALADVQWLVTCGADRLVIVWEAHTSRELARVELPGVVRCVEWAGAAPGVNASDVSERFVTAHNRFGAHPPALTVWRFDGKSIQELRVISKLPSAALQVRWGRANYFIASAHDSGELIFWRADTGAEVKRLKAHDAGISKFDFNDDRELVATVSHDMSVCIWDIGKGTEWRMLYKAQTDRPLNAVALGPLSQKQALGAPSERPGCICVVAAGGQDVRDVARSSSATEQFGTLLFRLGAAEKLPSDLKADGVTNKGHFGPVHTLAFAGNGSAIASGSEDGFVRVHIFDKEDPQKN